MKDYDLKYTQGQTVYLEDGTPLIFICYDFTDEPTDPWLQVRRADGQRFSGGGYTDGYVSEAIFATPPIGDADAYAEDAMDALGGLRTWATGTEMAIIHAIIARAYEDGRDAGR